MTLTISACTSGDSKSEIEGEMDDELDELAGDGLDAEITDEDAETEDDTALETEDAITADADSDLDGEAAAPAENSAQASAEGDLDDDEFLAEDAQAPASSVAASDDLAESDLEKELEKEAPPPSAGATAQNDMSEDMSAQMIPKEEPAPLQPPVAANGADEFDAPVVTSKESTIGTSDIFEPIPMPTVPKEDLGVSDPLVSEVDKPLPSLKAAQEVVPVAKINRKPFYENERLMNTVYIARPGDDLQSISMRIFNEDRSSQLAADNSGHLTKVLAPGEKVYYNSPNRPDDKKSILTFYEDNKMAPSYYTTEPGDDIQKIGRRVLGYEDAWKEVWAVNDSLQTQALLPAGLKVRYWSGNESKINEVASVDSGSAGGDPTKAADGAMMAQASPEDIEAPIDIPSPASMSQDMDSMASNQDPMSAPINTEPVPLLPDSPASVPAVTDPSKGNDSLATMAGIALVGLAGVALVAIQIKNRKKNDQGLPPSLEFTKV